MKKIINDTRNRILLKIASVNSLAMAIRIVSGFLTSKAIAVFIGTEGMALIGNLRDFLSSVQSFSTLGFSNGIVKYVAEFKNKANELSKTISTSVYIGLLATLLVTVYAYFDAKRLNDVLFTEAHDFVYVIRILAIALPLYAINAMVLAILNGLSQFKRILYINMTAQIVGMLLTVFLIWQQQLKGALIAVATVESLVFFVTLSVAFKEKYLLKLVRWDEVNIGSLKNLSIYSMMALFTALVLPLVTVTIRNYIMDSNGAHAAGLWEAMRRISGYYMMFVSTLLVLYILPRFSEIESKIEFRKEVFNFYKTIMPIFGLGLVVIYFIRSIIIKIIFTSEFIEVESLFFWQLLGDFVKVFALVISYQLLAKRMVLKYLFIEAFFVASYYFLSTFFIDKIGVEGAVLGHFVCNVVYLMAILIIFNKSLFGKAS